MKKEIPKTAAEREFAKFSRAVTELDARLDERLFNQVLMKLLAAGRSHLTEGGESRNDTHASDAGSFIPLRCDECYVKAEIVGDRELWPTDAPDCRHQPAQSCPRMKAAFARARGSINSFSLREAERE